jgi:hypothetical protein
MTTTATVRPPVQPRAPRAPRSSAQPASRSTRPVAPTISVLHEAVSAGQQSVTAQRLVVMAGHKLRFTVKSDAYDFQSSAKTERWQPIEGQWHTVTTLPYGLMKTPAKLVYQPNQSGVSLAHFEADLTELQRQAALILLP